ncbi:DUF935 family protein [Campylobacter sp. FMV-PI01]|uniref:DUF935 family protein n=1 Tax=Campylobacter portucalensis TaxID=2608384 RepID=A0A6L5WGN1_9BACT|nr:DUF935 family protein [Campylobacter portucalensis]
MLSGDVAVIDKDEEISITQPGKDSSHDKLITYLDEQIRNVILGGNLTSNVSSGSLAAANIHNQIREDISISDENIVLDVFKRTIKIFKEINGLNLDIDVVLISKADGDLDLAERDLKLFNMGFVPSKEYIEKTYGVILDEEEMKEFVKTKNENENLKPNKTAFKESLKKPKYLDKFDKALDSKDFSDGLKKTDDELEKALNEILNRCDTYEEAFDEFMGLYDAPLEEMENLMFKAVANSKIYGMFEEDKR